MTALSCFFFFFQAEDGIRDKLVTGVQTCALPIGPPGWSSRTELFSRWSRCAAAAWRCSPGSPGLGDSWRRSGRWARRSGLRTCFRTTTPSRRRTSPPRATPCSSRPRRTRCGCRQARAGRRCSGWTRRWWAATGPCSPRSRLAAVRVAANPAAGWHAARGCATSPAPMAQPVPLRARPSLAQLPQLFPRRRVLVVGDLVADHYIYGQTDRVSREAPVLVVGYESSEVKLGGGANAAANARALGGQVTAVGILGRDEMGQALRGLFRSAGIQLRAASSDAVQTETKTRILAGGLNTTRQQMLRLDRGNRGPLPAKLRMELHRLIAEAAREADAVVVSDY